MNNLKEYLAGTSPIDPASVLRISAIGMGGTDVRLGFASISGKSYRVEKSLNLGFDAFWSIVQNDMPGTGSVIPILDQVNGTQPRGFYRVSLK